MTEDELEKRAAEIFEQLVDLPAAERQLPLSSACGDDKKLEASVQSLLDAMPLAQDFLSSRALGSDETAAPDWNRGFDANIGERPGDLIGPYKLLEKIGEGGCGVVFMPEQERPVRRRVALKVIKLGMDTREVLARFRAERQAETVNRQRQ